MEQKERFDVVVTGHFFKNIIGATNVRQYWRTYFYKMDFC